jgi:hypothetical protein
VKRAEECNERKSDAGTTWIQSVKTNQSKHVSQSHSIYRPIQRVLAIILFFPSGVIKQAFQTFSVPCGRYFLMVDSLKSTTWTAPGLEVLQKSFRINQASTLCCMFAAPFVCKMIFCHLQQERTRLKEYVEVSV